MPMKPTGEYLSSVKKDAMQALYMKSRRKRSRKHGMLVR